MSEFALTHDMHLYRKDNILSVSPLKRGDDNLYFEITMSKQHLDYPIKIVHCSSCEKTADRQWRNFVSDLV